MATGQTVTHNFARHFDAVQRKFRRWPELPQLGMRCAYWVGLFDASTVTGASR